MNHKPENRIPLLLTDFDNIKDFPWLFQRPWKILIFFADFSVTTATVMIKMEKLALSVNRYMNMSIRRLSSLVRKITGLSGCQLAR